MKALTLTIFILLSQISFSQDVVRCEVADFITTEKIQKNITFTVVTTKNLVKVVIKAYNITESKSRSCEWEVNLKKEEALQFALKLNSATKNCNSKLDADWLTSYTIIKCVRNKLKIIMNTAVCTSGHPINYFQKECNKKLIFKIDKSKGKEIAENLNSILRRDNAIVVEK